MALSLPSINVIPSSLLAAITTLLALSSFLGTTFITGRYIGEPLGVCLLSTIPLSSSKRYNYHHLHHDTSTLNTAGLERYKQAARNIGGALTVFFSLGALFVEVLPVLRTTKPGDIWFDAEIVRIGAIVCIRAAAWGCLVTAVLSLMILGFEGLWLRAIANGGLLGRKRVMREKGGFVPSKRIVSV